MGTDNSAVVNGILRQLWDLQGDRIELMDSYFADKDPETINKILADAANLIQCLFVLNNFPEVSDGFISYGKNRNVNR